MFSPCRISLISIAVFGLGLAAAEARELRVCAEPDNLPFSDLAGRGFENRIAVLVANEIGARLVLVPVVQGSHGYIRATLDADLCDAIMGMPAAAADMATTAPYYRSSWVFVSRIGTPAPRSFADAELARMRIGVPMVGEGPDTPPAAALARRGFAVGLRTYPAAARRPDRIVQDVAEGKLDLAILWGAAAGYSVAQHAGAVALTTTPADDGAPLPMTLSIAIAVRSGNTALRDELNAALARNHAGIAAILAEYHVPVLDE